MYGRIVVMVLVIDAVANLHQRTRVDRLACLKCTIVRTIIEHHVIDIRHEVHVTIVNIVVVVAIEIRELIILCWIKIRLINHMSILVYSYIFGHFEPADTHL